MEEEYAVSIHETGYTYPKESGGYWLFEDDDPA